MYQYTSVGSESSAMASYEIQVCKSPQNSLAMVLTVMLKKICNGEKDKTQHYPENLKICLITSCTSLF